MIARLMVVLVLVLGSAPVAAGVTHVRLKAGARVPGDGAVTLGDVAEVEGPQAGLLVGVVVLEDLAAASAGKAFATVGVREVRERVLATPGVVQGRLQITGAQCVVGTRRAPAPRPARAHRETGGVPETVTLRSQIVEHLRALFDVPAERIRVSFDERDGGVLGQSVEGLAVEIRSLGGSDRMPLAITAYAGDRVAINTTIRVGVELERAVAVATEALSRGQQVHSGQVSAQTRWVSATVNPVPPEEAVGRVVKGRVAPGSVLTAATLDRPVHVERGGLVSIRSVVGTAVVRTRARALGDGVQGEVVEFESLDRSTRFLARVAGPGQAVVAPATALSAAEVSP